MATLPLAQKDISVHPAQASVVDPVNPAALSQDVDRKVFVPQLLKFIFHRFLSYYIALYGVVEAFRTGRLPTNIQIDKTLQYYVYSRPFSSRRS